MSTTAPVAPPASAGPVAGLRRALVAEVIKLRTTRTTLGLLITGVVLSALQGGLVASIAGRAFAGQEPSPGPEEPWVLRQIYGSGAGYGYLVTLSLGVLAMSGEYRHQTITPSFLAVPRRGRVVTAKLLANLAVAGVLGVAFVLAGAATGAVVLSLRGYPLGLDTPGVPRAMALAALVCALWSIFGFGLATIIRNQIAVMLTALGLASMVVPLLGFALQSIDDVQQIAPYLPTSAGEAMVAGSSTSSSIENGGITVDYLPWWGGALVLTAYGLVFAVVGARLTMRRDVS